MALYGPAVKKLIPPGPNDPRITPRVAILHVDAGNTDSLYGWFNGPSGGVESHFHIKKSGVVEQYRDTAWQADANTDANDFAISIETQGYGEGEWTPAQLTAIKALLLWCHETHGIPLVKCKTWDGSGVGYHTLFRGDDDTFGWDKRGASCPGPDRIKQFDNELVPWMATSGDEDFMDVKNPLTGEKWPAAKALWSIWDSAINAENAAESALAIVTAMAKVGRPLTAAETADAVKVGLDKVNARATVNLTVEP